MVELGVLIVYNASMLTDIALYDICAENFSYLLKGENMNWLLTAFAESAAGAEVRGK